MSATKISPRIYVACLASYNAGRLHGAWIDAGQDADDIQAAVSAMLAASPAPDAEEWAIHDSEGLGRIGEWESFERVAAIGQAIAEAGDDAPALLAWLDDDNDNDPEEFADCYAGCWESLADFAYDINDGNSLTGRLDHYIDWESVGRDLRLSGDVWTADARDGGVYVYWSR
jgi:antirestriction protein